MTLLPALPRMASPTSLLFERTMASKREDEIGMASMTPDLARTLHLATRELPWVTMTPNTELRMIHAKLDDDFVAVQFRAHPNAEYGVHRHLAPSIGFTTAGAWGHDRNYEYRPGSYIYETPGVLHQFLNGPEMSEVFFLAYGVLENVDVATNEVVSRVSVGDMVKRYLEGCEENGLPRPNFLG